MGKMVIGLILVIMALAGLIEGQAPGKAAAYSAYDEILYFPMDRYPETSCQ